MLYEHCCKLFYFSFLFSVYLKEDNWTVLVATVASCNLEFCRGGGGQVCSWGDAGAEDGGDGGCMAPLVAPSLWQLAQHQLDYLSLQGTHPTEAG